MKMQFFRNIYGDTATITKMENGTAKLIVRDIYGREYHREMFDKVGFAKYTLSDLAGGFFTIRGWVED